jgi:hypothetical protein
MPVNTMNEQTARKREITFADRLIRQENRVVGIANWFIGFPWIKTTSTGSDLNSKERGILIAKLAGFRKSKR